MILTVEGCEVVSSLLDHLSISSHWCLPMTWLLGLKNMSFESPCHRVSDVSCHSVCYIQELEQFEILPYLQTNKLASPNFMYPERRHETPGSETNDFIIHSNTNSLSVTLWATSPSPNSHKSMKSRPGDASTYTESSYRRGTLSFRNPNLLQWAVNLSDFCLRREHYLYYTGHYLNLLTLFTT